ncbi:MAG: hypothetical protein GC204_20580 [Chloroflexi bacterium]|nr:hypothetical protein [Chloroflexota bacterium]
MKRLLFIILLLGLFTSLTSTSAQDTRFQTTAYRSVYVFQGPGVTFLLLGQIPGDVPMTIIERNNIGTWVHIQRKDSHGNLLIEGWIISGYLHFDLDFHFNEVPVNTNLPDADPNADKSQLHDLYVVPVIPSTISDAMREVYRHGHDDLHNYSHVITKVGDSMTADDLYLKPMSRTDTVLGPYDYLGDTILYFGASTAVDSVAARVGMTSYTIFDPAWADKKICEPNESPLDCEYRRKRPSISLILFSANDLKAMDDARFDVQMRAVVDNTISHGIIPVLSTFSYDPNGGLWFQAVNFNRRIIKIAADYQLPVINLWLAARALPAFGLEVDDIHMKHWGSENLRFDNGSVAFSGAALRNLLSIKVLDEIRNDVILPAANSTDSGTPEATAAP